MFTAYTLPYLAFARLHRYAIDARRRDRTWRYFAWSALAGTMTAAMIAFGAGFAWLFWYAGIWWAALILISVLVMPAILAQLARHVIVPLGWHRAAYFAGVFSRPGNDGVAYGMCLAAWAYSQRPTPRAEDWLAKRRDGRIPLGDGEVVVTALVAAGKGDASTTRQLLRSIALLVEDHPSVRELAGEWLAVDAVERAAWFELHADAAAARWPATPLTYFLEGVAARRVGASGAPGRYDLIARWVLAPHRHVTFDLLEDPPAPPAPPAISEPDAPTDEPQVHQAPLPRAVAAHLAFGSHDASQGKLADTVRAWDAALADGATHAWLARRALELDAPLGAVDRALREVATAVTDQLAKAADAALLGAPASAGAVGNELARRLRHGRLDALEQGFTRWAQRRHDGNVRSSIDEWREFVALRDAYTNAVTGGGTELRRLAFPHAFSTGSNMAAWLWNARNEHVLSHAISKWLLDEALAVGDAEAIELGHRNCSLTVPTRLGNVQQSSRE